MSEPELKKNNGKKIVFAVIAGIILLGCVAGGYFYWQAQSEKVKQEAKAKCEAEAQAKREAEAQAKREAEAQAKREAEEKAKREAEEKAKREAEEKAKAKREAEERKQYTAQLPNGVTLEMVKVEAGTFTMSKRDGENYDNEVEHTARLTKDFYIGKTEVTQAQWRAVMGNNPSKFKGDNLPVECVSWHDAMKFCKKLNELTEGNRPAGYHYTLPMETQWEFACRGGNRNKGYKYSGSNNIDAVAWYDKISRDKTHEVGGKDPNELGLYDMSGNVSEWCLDDYKSDSRDAVAEFTRGDDQSSALRVIRGLSWHCSAGDCRSARRGGHPPGRDDYRIGFRLALAPEKY